MSGEFSGGKIFLGWGVGKNVGIPMQNYKSRRPAVMIRDTLVNTQTHTQAACDWLYYKLSQLS